MSSNADWVHRRPQHAVLPLRGRPGPPASSWPLPRRTARRTSAGPPPVPRHGGRPPGIDLGTGPVQQGGGSGPDLDPHRTEGGCGRLVRRSARVPRGGQPVRDAVDGGRPRPAHHHPRRRHRPTRAATPWPAPDTAEPRITTAAGRTELWAGPSSRTRVRLRRNERRGTEGRRPGRENRHPPQPGTAPARGSEGAEESRPGLGPLAEPGGDVERRSSAAERFVGGTGGHSYSVFVDLSERHCGGRRPSDIGSSTRI